MHITSSASRKPWAVLALGILAIACSVWHLHITDRQTTRNSDLMAPWVATRIAFTGRDPYALSTTQEIQSRFYGHVLGPNEKKDHQAFAYPLFTVYLVAPFAALPWTVARIVFVALGVPLIAGAVLLWLRLLSIRASWQQAAICVLLTMASWPVIVVLRQQQLTLLLFLLLTAGLYARARGWLVLAGVLMGLSIMKPQLALLPLVWEMATAIRGREWRLLASMVGTGLFLFLSADLLHPGWLREWVIGLMRYRQYTGSQPAMELWFGAWVGGALLIVVTAVAFVALWRQRNDEARRTSPLVLALTVTLCPTTVYWIYNQILLLPACLLLVFDDPETRVSAILRRITFALLGWGFLAVALAILVETVLQPNLLLDLLPCFNYLLPLLLTIALSLPYLAKKPRVKASPVTVDEGELMFAVD